MYVLWLVPILGLNFTSFSFGVSYVWYYDRRQDAMRACTSASWWYCQIFILAERTRNDLPISPTHSGVTTSNTQNKPTSIKLGYRIFSLTSCITYDYFSHLKLPCVEVAQSANPPIESLILYDGSNVSRFRPWASHK